jgi:hypothetical protein
LATLTHEEISERRRRRCALIGKKFESGQYHAGDLDNFAGFEIDDLSGFDVPRPATEEG